MSALGTNFKINIHVDSIDGLHMSDYEFECILYVHELNSVVFKKGDLNVKKTDDDNYRVCVDNIDALRLGRGAVKLKFIAHIPDADFTDGYRTEIYDKIKTGVIIE